MLIYDFFVGGTTSFSLNLKKFSHQLGFWFLNDATATTSSVTFNLTADVCASGVGSECVGT